MSGGLPVVPVYDLAVKGDELVVATHGRSFWILDDLNPLRELTRNSADSPGVRLFPPRSRVRARRQEIDVTDARPGYVNYANADTSPVLWDTVTGHDGQPAVRLLTAGTNPPAGMVVTWHLPHSPVTDATLSFQDPAGTECRQFSLGGPGVPVVPGVSRFTWNLRSPGATSLEDVPLDSWERPDGPLIVPGDYEVRLTVDGETVSRPFTLLPDPRNTSPIADLVALREMLLEILASLSRTNETIIRVESLRAQASAWLAWASDPAVTAAAQAVIDATEPLRPQLIDIGMHEAQLWPSGLHEKFNALFESVDSADFAPPTQARDVLAKLTTELNEIVGTVEEIGQEEVGQLNALLRQGATAYVG